jgi:hypothetical protein
MAADIVRLYREEETRQRLITNGMDAVQPYAWPEVKGLWLSLYNKVKAEK